MKTQKETAPNNALDTVLRNQRKGALLSEASEALQKLTQAVRETGKAGELTIKLKLTPNGESVMAITDDVKLKLPSPAKVGTIFYSTDDNVLTRQDPDQKELSEIVKVVDAPQNAAPLKIAVNQ